MSDSHSLILTRQTEFEKSPLLYWSWVFYYTPQTQLSISNTIFCNTLLIGVQNKTFYIYTQYMILYLDLCIFASTDVYYYLKDPPPEFLPRFGTITMAGLLGMFLARKGNWTWCNHKHATGFTVSAALGSESLFKCGSSLWLSWRLFRSHSLHMCLNNSLHLMNHIIWSKQLSIHSLILVPGLTVH